jgi:hypothetical protein
LSSKQKSQTDHWSLYLLKSSRQAGGVYFWEGGGAVVLIHAIVNVSKGEAAQIERKVNLRLRIILKALLAGAMRVTRSCSRAVDVLCTRLGSWKGGYLWDIAD